MCKISGSKYLMCISFVNSSSIPAVEVDINTMATRPIEDLSDAKIKSPVYILSRNDYIMYVCKENDVMILKYGKFQCNLGLRPRLRYDKNYNLIRGRWHQHFRDNVYMIDTGDNLYSMSWSDIEHGPPVALKLIDSQVEDFYVTRKGMAIFYKNGDLKLPGPIKVDSKAMPAGVKSPTIIYTSNRWIIAGDKEGYAVLATLSTKGLVQSSLTIKLTHNGSRPAEYPTLKYLRIAAERRYCSLILAFGIDSCCHLISMRRSGQLILVQSIASILDTNVHADYNSEKITLSVTDTGIEGQFIMTGYKQINMISLKFK